MLRKHYIIILLSVLLCSCASRRLVERVVVERHDTVRVEGIRLDSVFVHDSVSVYVAGDTVFETRWRTEYRDRWRDVVRDVVREVHDTATVEKVIEVQRKRNIVDRGKDALLVVFGFLLLALLGLKAVRNVS